MMSKEDLCYAVVHGLKLSYLSILDHKILPHDGVALTDFLHGVVEFSGEPSQERLIAVKTPCEDERPFIGHFPDDPVWPTWARFEMACLSGAMFFYCLYGKEAGLPIFGSDDRSKSPAVVRPGDLIYAEITKPRRKGRAFAFSARLYKEHCGDQTTVYQARRMMGFIVNKNAPSP
jgi:3-hydroxymyristoyl/3-hydroxydecanoyl-(acyl carrier protein) dehydratase